MAKKQDMTYLNVKTFEDNWCPIHGLLSSLAQTKIGAVGHSAEENKTKCLVLREVEPAPVRRRPTKKTPQKESEF